IVALALVALVVRDDHVHVEIAVRRVRRPRHALARHAQPLAGVDSSRERHQHGAALLHEARAAAALPRGRDVLPAAPAGGAGGAEHDEPALRGDLAVTLAVRAAVRARARFGAGPVAVFAGRGAANGHLLLGAAESVLEGDGRFYPDVLPALGL